MIAAGMISPFSIDDAIGEAQRCVNAVGPSGQSFCAPISSTATNWHEPYYEPLWSALEDLGVPLGFHEANNSLARQAGDNFGYDFMLRHTYAHPVEQMLAVGAFCGGGILARHPKLKVAFLEGNCGWLPFLLWRLDEHWEQYGDQWAPGLENPPSFYFKRQCYASVECDEEPVKYTIDYWAMNGWFFPPIFPTSTPSIPMPSRDFSNCPSELKISKRFSGTTARRTTA
jgi:predicted TIM-barrel fold metal-dependent hydrolase